MTRSIFRALALLRRYDPTMTSPTWSVIGSLLQVILSDLKKKAAEPPPLIDVISASRTPSASKEPHYRTRYESHVFACESLARSVSASVARSHRSHRSLALKQHPVTTTRLLTALSIKNAPDSRHSHLVVHEHHIVL